MTLSVSDFLTLGDFVRSEGLEDTFENRALLGTLVGKLCRREGVVPDRVCVPVPNKVGGCKHVYVNAYPRAILERALPDLLAKLAKWRSEREESTTVDIDHNGVSKAGY